MLANIRLLLFQMLVLVDYQGDKDVFITNFIHQCHKRLSPAYPTSGDYYAELQKAALQSVNTYVKKIAPSLHPNQVRNLKLLAKSFSA